MTKLIDKIACPNCFSVTKRCVPSVCHRECVSVCAAGAIVLSKEQPTIDPKLCSNCAECVFVCPLGAIDRSQLKQTKESFICESCSREYPVINSIVNLRTERPVSELLLKFAEAAEFEALKSKEHWGVFENKGKSLASLFNTGHFEEVIDIGCGIGSVLNEFANIKGISTQNRFGCDLSLNTLSYARTKFPEVTFVCADAENLPFKNKAFQLALCTDVLEHVPHPEKAFREINRISCRAGIKVPLEDSFFPLVPKVWNWLFYRNVPPVGHINRFNLSYLESVFKKNGCNVIHTNFVNITFENVKNIISTLKPHGKLHAAVYYPLAIVFYKILPVRLFSRLFNTVSIFVVITCKELNITGEHNRDITCASVL